MDHADKTISDDAKKHFAHMLIAEMVKNGHTPGEIKQIGATISLEAEKMERHHEPLPTDDSEWLGAPNEDDNPPYTSNNPEGPGASFGDPSLRTDTDTMEDHTHSHGAGGSKKSRPTKKTKKSQPHANMNAGVKKPKGPKRHFNTIPENIARDTNEFAAQCPAALNEEDREAWSRCRSLLVDPDSYNLKPETETSKPIMDKLAWSRQVLRFLQEVADGLRDRNSFHITGMKVKHGTKRASEE